MALEDRISIFMPEGGELELQLAGLASRFIAGTVDLIIQLLVVGGLVLVTGAASGGGNLNLVVLVIGVFVVSFGYPIAFELLARGRTPGKRLTHLRVVRDQGDAVDLPASVIRNLIRVFDGATLLYVPTVVAILATRHNQRPGDIAAGTLVIRDAPLGPRSSRRRPGSAAGSAAESAAGSATGSAWVPAPAPAPTAAEPRSGSGRDWDVSGVSTQELATVRRFLERRDTLAREARASLARRLADGLAAKVAGAPREGSAEQFLETLVQVTSERSGGR